MEKFTQPEELIGFQLIHDVYTRNKKLLIAAATILTKEHVRMLQLHKITLTSKDVKNAGPYSPVPPNEESQLINEMVSRLYPFFQEIQHTKKIMLGELRKQVVPLVQSVVEQPNLLKVLAALQSKDDYLYRHPIGVAILATLIGKWMQMEEAELLQLTTAALLHDIGKLKIPSEILHKPTKLTSDEFEMMKKHTIHGYTMIKETIGASSRQALVALQHHERNNGTGYPFGIREENIDLFSQIVSIADVFHAITSNKVYGGAFPFFQVLDEMNQSSYGALNPAIVRILIAKLMQCLIGNKVVLTDGSSGVIVMINPFDPIHPMIQTDASFVDLRKEPSIQIEQIIP
ncbi:HD-GYP domain-containing protein [Brevibacillus fulvus]|uniref:HD-GYP domain-containing protein (C-di-GMP phosphodiesterase class II) n=1 Tax=Brevibacillus fulvus TaxID=1125967 RepID=A0A939BV59_9BACL|nr:HD-GYP domain-containing protein [Brevibacillus fulvus]MBM7591139.1 HD-GYP domain-containing protein (c-di-GMP phosphodiesterase class II) [Brevibacillus fulvus]